VYCNSSTRLSFSSFDGESARKEIGVHISILIVDDNPIIRQAVRRGFQERNGFQVCGEAIDGRDGIEKARQLKPDLIILDFSMPVMNGLEAAAVLTREMPSVPLILFTMHVGSVVASEARLTGVSAVVSKDQGSEGLVSQALTLLGLPSDR
jgi:two-component system, NarL family, nitrate/nitrite response regulator NarL